VTESAGSKLRYRIDRFQQVRSGAPIRNAKPTLASLSRRESDAMVSPASSTLVACQPIIASEQTSPHA
jgi:hypothetical protein